MKEIVLEVHCIGCKAKVSPMDIDMELFRVGIILHPACAESATYCKIDDCMQIAWGDKKFCEKHDFDFGALPVEFQRAIAESMLDASVGRICKAHWLASHIEEGCR